MLPASRASRLQKREAPLLEKLMMRVGSGSPGLAPGVWDWDPVAKLNRGGPSDRRSSPGLAPGSGLGPKSQEIKQGQESLTRRKPASRTEQASKQEGQTPNKQPAG